MQAAARSRGFVRMPASPMACGEARSPVLLNDLAIFVAESLTRTGKQTGDVMTGLRPRRATAAAALTLAGLLFSPAAANAGACDAKRAQSLVGKSYSPRLEETALAL